MFENPLPVMENETYTLKHTRLIIINKSENAGLRKRVCLKTLCLITKTAKHTRLTVVIKGSKPCLLKRVCLKTLCLVTKTCQTYALKNHH